MARFSGLLPSSARHATRPCPSLGVRTFNRFQMPESGQNAMTLAGLFTVRWLAARLGEQAGATPALDPACCIQLRASRFRLAPCYRSDVSIQS